MSSLALSHMGLLRTQSLQIVENLWNSWGSEDQPRGRVMALRRDTARNLKRAIASERAFVDAVATELEAKRIKRKDAEKLIVNWFQNRHRVEFQIEWALRDQHGL